ncbi:MAG TPA: protein kinase [Thermoanaerobaculia bacterium]|nr:protein kinase [Thermoanaerobaculia bacterium]
MTLFSKPKRGGDGSPPEDENERALKELVRAGEWRKAAALAAEMKDDDKLVKYALMSGLGRMPEGVVPEPRRAADILARQGCHEEALLLFERLADYTQAGESALALQQISRAARYFRQARAWEQAARCFEEAGELREALQTLQEGEERIDQSGLRAADKGRSERLKLRRAEILLKLSRADLAATVLSSLPASPRTAELLELAGRHEEALQRYLDLGRIEEATALAARSPQRERLQAKIHLRSGRPIEAGDLFALGGFARDAAEAYEAGGEWSRAAYRWEAAREPRRAAEAYEKAGRLRDSARCFEVAGQPQLAAEVRKRAVSSGAVAAGRLHPASSQVRKAREHLSAGDTVKAAWILTRMLPEEPGFAEGALLLAPMLLEARFCKEALDRLRLIPTTAEPAILLERDYWEARCFEAQEQTADALLSYSKVLERDIKFRDARQRSVRLQNATGTPDAPVISGGLPVGSRLAGRYEILAEIGHGGMGRVYRAHDHDLGEVVAIKTVLTSSEGGSGDEARLLREIQICRRISHPNVVRVHDLGRFDRGLFVTMEYLEGTSLDQVIEREAPLPFSRIRTLLGEAAAGLQEAHGQGIVHRDLKPGNFIVTANRLKILDFGIASMRGLSGRLTQVGMVLGSPMYMSPEQIRGRDVDGRSDLYSLGLIAYALVAGREAFELNEPTVLVLQKLREDPPDIRTIRPDTPESWATLVMRLLAREPEDRFANAGELLDALAQLPASPDPLSTRQFELPSD